ncbi:MAG: GNAT family N-acetyltransferase [Saprospiraceae bacterium]
MSFRQNHQVVTSTVLAKADWHTVLELWNTGFPVEVQLTDVGALRKIIEAPNCAHYVLRNAASKIEAWLAVFDRYDTRWFSILVSPEAQGQGLGKALILHAKTVEHCLEGWVVQSDDHFRADGEVYTSPLAFYKKLGFRLNPNRFPSDGKLDVVCVKWD